MRTLEIRRLGVVPYQDALVLQRALVEERRAGSAPDLLLLLQHLPVITLGVKGDGGRSNITAGAQQLSHLGIDISETGRGGNVTYHGPGQLIGYPLIDLRPDRCDVHRYVRNLEDVMIQVCADYGVSAKRLKGLTGAWVGEDKIGAIGVRISRWITSHGFAFNVNPNIDHFGLIVPCGIPNRGVTSLQRAVGRDVSIVDVENATIRHFCDVFECEANQSAFTTA